MKKEENKTKKTVNKTRFWIGVIIIVLLLGAVITALTTGSPYAVATGVLIGFLVSFLSNKLRG